jgi:NitT/TauT family transport system ATP-binding protein
MLSSLKRLTTQREATPAAGVPLLEVAGVTLRYRARGKKVTALENATFNVVESERVMLLGPSGCGKSSLLKAIGGFLPASEGAIRLRGHLIKGPGPDRGLVFQEFDQLLPWKTVKQNVAFGLRAARKFARKEADQIAMDHLEKVRLSKFADAYPHTLSGGMKQRVAIARCLALRPEIVLMDEPFAALDELSRQRMQEELLQLWEDYHFTLVFVTHSIAEALTLGSRVLLLSPHPGRIRSDLAVDQTLRAKSSELHAQIQLTLSDETSDYVI